MNNGPNTSKQHKEIVTIPYHRCVGIMKLIGCINIDYTSSSMIVNIGLFMKLLFIFGLLTKGNVLLPKTKTSFILTDIMLLNKDIRSKSYLI